MTATTKWQFWIDRGGTFTDCLGVDPQTGEVRTTKVLSADRAPLTGIRRILGIEDNAVIPPCDVRMGTTIATNALLERKGASTALVITRGFADLLEIGDQTRPSLFALNIEKTPAIYRRVIEVDARAAPSGELLEEPDPIALEGELRDAHAQGMSSLAVVVLHAYAAPELESRILAIAERAGFSDVTLSHRVAREIGLVGRGDTTVVDAYLTPLIAGYLRALARELPGSRIRLMQSSGDLTDASRFRGKDAVLSGPAGGVVATDYVARQAGFERSIGFDMGGTSTDVCCISGEFERSYETRVAGVRLRAPMLALHTVAAGGGSICSFDGYRFAVGPDSAGADPGPLCYGKPEATELTITDCNLFLGRVIDDRFPFRLDRERVRRKLESIRDDMAARGAARELAEIAEGFVAVANTSMAEAIRQVTVARGRDARDHALVTFGGAGGQHGCAVARLLGVKSIVVDRFAGVQSAFGMGLALLGWHGEADAGRLRLEGELPSAVRDRLDELERDGRETLRRDGVPETAIEAARRLDLRYRGTDSAITIAVSGDGDGQVLRSDFEREHRARFGYARQDAIEIVTARVEVTGREHDLPALSPPGESATGAPLRELDCWVDGAFRSIPVFSRDDLRIGQALHGPALILDDTGTLMVDTGFSLEVQRDARLLLVDSGATARRGSAADSVDPILLEIYNNSFMSIASQMGEALRRTAVSVNIRERLDFSCAVFDAHGGLVANAPHIPVHLGAMSESIRALLAAHPAPPPGSVFASNDPRAGGSHLPDITVISPVHDERGELAFFTASRGHHADIGGITPGSMPPMSRSLEEEGIVLTAMQLVDGGEFLRDRVLGALASGPYPARQPDDNISDLEAQIAANQTGATLLARLVRERGRDEVAAYMGHIQDNAATQVARQISRLPDGDYRFADALDDGTPVCVLVSVAGDRMRIDFDGTGPASTGNLNAPRAVTSAAVLYVLRLLVAADIPLNSGCMRNVEVSLPPGSLLDPPPGAAVAGGNVETSQRIVDVLLAALGLAAASQGTMNNLTFGNARFGYYETICGGAGATATAPGASAVHTHMTNTRITDPEILEARFPVRLHRFAIRRGSGGDGAHRGGDGAVREIEFLEDVTVSILSERRLRAPFGLEGGRAGSPGRNSSGGRNLGGRVSTEIARGGRICIESPGGGGYGVPGDRGGHGPPEK